MEVQIGRWYGYIYNAPYIQIQLMNANNSNNVML